MRRLFVLVIAPVIFVAGWSLPTTAEGSTSVAPIADYLHQVAASVPAPRAPLFDEVEAGTEARTCAPMLSALRKAQPGAAHLLTADAPEPVRKAAAQVLAYTAEVERLCGPTPR